MATEKKGRSRGAERDRHGEGPREPDDVANVLEELGERATYITVWRVAGGKEYHLGRWAIGDYDPATTIQSHKYGGGGEYRYRIAGPRDSRSRGQWIKVGTFNIAGPPNDGSGAPASDDKKAEGMPWWAQGIIATLPVVAGGVVAMLTREKKTDPVLLALLEGVGRGSGPDAVAVQQLVETARKNGLEEGIRLGAAEERAENPGGGDNADGPLTTAIREGMQLMGKIMDDHTTKTKTPQATARLAPPGGTAPAMPEWVAEVRKYLPVILTWPATGKNPEVKAVNLVDDLPEKYRDQLAASCESDTFVRDVFGYLPELSATDDRRQWFTTFLVTLQNILAPEGEDDDGTEGEGGAAPGDGEDDSDGDGTDDGTGGGDGATDGDIRGDAGGSRDAVAGAPGSPGAVPPGAGSGPRGPGGNGESGRGRTASGRGRSGRKGGRASRKTR